MDRLESKSRRDNPYDPFSFDAYSRNYNLNPEIDVRCRGSGCTRSLLLEMKNLSTHEKPQVQ